MPFLARAEVGQSYKFFSIQNSIEDFSPEANINLSKRFFDYIAKKLDVPDSRAYMFVPSFQIITYSMLRLDPRNSSVASKTLVQRTLGELHAKNRQAAANIKVMFVCHRFRSTTLAEMLKVQRAKQSSA